MSENNEFTNTLNLSEKQKEKARETIMNRWRNEEPILQPPSV